MMVPGAQPLYEKRGEPPLQWTAGTGGAHCVRIGLETRPAFLQLSLSHLFFDQNPICGAVLEGGSSSISILARLCYYLLVPEVPPPPPRSLVKPAPLVPESRRPTPDPSVRELSEGELMQEIWPS